MTLDLHDRDLGDERDSTKTNTEVSLFRLAVAELDRHRTLASLLVASMATYAAAHAAMAAVAGLLARELSASSPLPIELAAWLPDLKSGSYLTLFKFGLIATLVKAASGSLLAFGRSTLSSRVSHRLRVRAVDSLLAKGAGAPAPQVAATLRTRLLTVETAVCDGVVASARALAQLGALALCLIVVSPLLAFAACAVLGVFGFLLARARNRLKRAGERSQGLAEALAIGELELLENLDLWRSYGAGPRVRWAIVNFGRRAGRAAAAVAASRAALSGTNEVLGAVALLGTVALAAHSGVAVGDGRLVAFVTVFFMAYRPLRDLGEARGHVVRGAEAVSAIRRLDARSSVLRTLDRKEPETAKWPHPPQLLQLVAFGSHSRGPQTSAVIASGTTVCLRGPTGSGKTTLFRCLLGLEPTRGRLLYGEHDLTDAVVGPRARPFAWVPQDAPLVTGTVADNVALGGAEARAKRALRQVGAPGLIEGDRVVGPGGHPLSGGERRQIALARAVASGSPVLLLDEPTEGLDAESRDAMLEAIAALHGERTVIIATHRDEVAALADEVVPIGNTASPVPAKVPA